VTNIVFLTTMSSEDSPEKASTELEQEEESSTTIPPTTTWQAIFAPQYNTYYFYNPVTQETTWINPLQQPQPDSEASTSSTTAVTQETPWIDPLQQPQPEGSTSSTTAVTQETTWINPEPEASTSSTTAARYAALQEAALAQGVDPLLAHLDPSLLAPSVPGSSGGPSGMFSFLTSP
jgi:WW domain